ncbi:DUF58 domain-containing protein [Agromyces sp. PvR057]|uniref:DUF58 domain-containing protein n=1 Tax=Agromyces sp. PvR057 TaxID=3156403 RepID=UPI000E26356D
MSSAAERRPGAPRAAIVESGRAVADAASVASSRIVRTIGAFLTAIGRRLAVWGSVATPLGWTFVVAGAGAALLAFAFGWRELIAASVVVAVLLLVAMGFIVGRSAYRVSIDLADARVVVGDPAFGRLEIANPGRRRIPAADLELPVGVGRASFRVPTLAAGEEREEVFRIPTQRRAVLQLGPARSVRRDPLRLLQRSLRLGVATELFVHPRTVRLESASTGFLRDLEGLPTRDLSNDDVAFHALREYVAGDDLRHVHWKSTARTQRLMVRQFEETRRSQLAVVLATRESDYLDDEEFELAVSVAGSVGLQALAEGKQVTVLGAATAMPAEHPRRLLDGLSGVERSDRGAPVAEIARTVAREVPGASVVFVVFGSGVAPEHMRAVSAALPTSARAFAARAALTEQPSRRSVGALAVLTVPELDDLPRVIARAES